MIPTVNGKPVVDKGLDRGAGTLVVCCTEEAGPLGRDTGENRALVLALVYYRLKFTVLFSAAHTDSDSVQISKTIIENPPTDFSRLEEARKYDVWVHHNLRCDRLQGRRDACLNFPTFRENFASLDGLDNRDENGILRTANHKEPILTNSAGTVEGLDPSLRRPTVRP
ncbi:hypothetical protein Y032_0373g168 [Ancylostoma ceylanicum]|uniref:Uncharacterized protein n=1 Tax=Ancylostoma ceylanicum TaxID=53326 RepID=A0A016RUZ6_9BILA|nr:hypothetical protein Y032_0373g168 [Ancylostoma ceylanicum]